MYLELSTLRCNIVGLNQIEETKIIRYYLENAQHLRLAGGPLRDSEEQVQAMLNAWQDNAQNSTADPDLRCWITQDDNLIGTVGVTNIVRGPFQAAYMGYTMAQNKQGQGLMTEALEAIVGHAFNGLNLHRLMANYRPENIASGRVLEKLGFIKEGYAKNYLMVDGQWCDHILTSLTNPAWIHKTE